MLILGSIAYFGIPRQYYCKLKQRLLLLKVSVIKTWFRKYELEKMRQNMN